MPTIKLFHVGSSDMAATGRRLFCFAPNFFEKLYQFEVYETNQKCVAASYVLTLMGRLKILNTHNFVENSRKILILVLKNFLVAKFSFVTYELFF